MVKMKVSETKSLNAGDILEDRHGNKMVVIEANPWTVGGAVECMVLLNGRVKRVNTKSPYIIKSYKKSTKD